MRSCVLSVILLAATCAATAQLPFFNRGANSGFNSYGKITSFLLNVPLASPPLTSLGQFPLKSFTYALYPTASSGAEGMIPGNTTTGEPQMITVERGIYDHHTDTNNPIEFQIIKDDVTELPKAPDKQGLLVYSVLYTGAKLANCTGVVQVLELEQGKLMLADQFSYDCRGGASAEWNAHKRQLTVRSARYSFGDQPCCPSRYDSVVFKLDGQRIKTGDKTIGNQ
ncbi:MAG: hypothetical protein ACRD1C_07175 [Terriglobales bacterium]